MKKSRKASEYRDAYIDLNSASILESRIFITDVGADGLRSKREVNQPFDSQDVGNRAIRFDGNWREQKMSEQQYMQIFTLAEANYAAALQVLVSTLKKNQAARHYHERLRISSEIFASSIINASNRTSH